MLSHFKHNLDLILILNTEHSTPTQASGSFTLFAHVHYPTCNDCWAITTLTLYTSTLLSLQVQFESDHDYHVNY